MSQIKNNTRSFSLDEAKELIKEIIAANRANVKKGIRSRISLCIEGEAGIGKTTMPQDLAEEMNIGFVKINLGQIEELGDLVGFPIKKFELKKGDSVKLVEENLLPAYIAGGWEPTDSPPVLGYAAPEWISGKGESGILMLDDYPRADARMIQATMELIDRGQYISWTLPEDWHIILTSNPDTEDYIVNTMDVAQKTRLFNIEVVFDKEVWADWATRNNIPSRCIDFILLNSEVVRTKFSKGKGATARSWSKFFHAVSPHVGDGNISNVELIETLGSASVGSELIAQFVTFLDNKGYELPDMQEVVFSEDIDKWISKFEELVNADGEYRPDIASAIGTKFSTYVSYALDRKLVEDREQFHKNIEAVITSQVLGIDMSYALTQSLMSKNRVQLSKVLIGSAVRKYIVS